MNEIIDITVANSLLIQEWIAIIVGFPVLFALRNSYQFLESREVDPKKKVKYNSTWHTMQGITQLIFFYVVARLFQNVWAGISAAFAFWFVFDIVINLVGLKKGPFYIGGSAGLDKFFRGLNWPNGTMLIVKILGLAVSIWMYLK